MNKSGSAFKYLFIALLFIWSAHMFFPGSYSVDSWAIFDQAVRHCYTDWYSPAIVFVWGLLYSLTGLYYSMYLLQLFFYWLFVAILLIMVNKKTSTFFIGILAALILLFIPQYVMKDAHLAISWGIAASLLILAANDNDPANRRFTAVAAFLLLTYGLFARVNMVVALLPLSYIFIQVYYTDSRGVFFKNIAAIFICALLLAGNQFFSYKVLHAEKTYPQYKLRLLDIAGISIASGHNYFPACITTYKDYNYDTIVKKYTPASFDDIYWPGNSAPVIPYPDSALNDCVNTAWGKAIAQHPGIYLQNRMNGFLYYLRIKKRFTTEPYWDATVWIEPNNPVHAVMPANAFRGILYSVWAPLVGTFVFAPWFWLLLNAVFFIYYMVRYRRNRTRHDWKVLAYIQLSGVIAILSQFPIYQHDRDFRYNFWNVFVLLIGCVCIRRKKKPVA